MPEQQMELEATLLWVAQIIANETGVNMRCAVDAARRLGDAGALSRPSPIRTTCESDVERVQLAIARRLRDEDSEDAKAFNRGLRAANAAVLAELGAMPLPRPAGGEEVDDDPLCTDCDGTGITKQTEKPCSCDAALTKPAALPHAGLGRVSPKDIYYDAAENYADGLSLDPAADIRGEVVAAYIAGAAEFSGDEPAALPKGDGYDREEIARVLFEQRQTKHDWDASAEAHPESDAGTLRSICFDDADAVISSLPRPGEDLSTDGDGEVARQVTRLRELLARATPTPWQLQDGCSWRRIGTAFHDGDVLCPSTYSREDSHPDLTARDGRLYDNLRLIVEGINALSTLIAALSHTPKSEEVGK